MAESTDLRVDLWDRLINAPYRSVTGFKESVLSNAWGKWLVYNDRSGSGARDSFYIIISPERNGRYQQYSQGSWIIKRNIADGSFVQAKIFLRSDSSTFARIYPNGSRSKMDIIAYGAVFYREIPLPVSFETIMKSDFSRIVKMSSDIVDWNLFAPDPALYSGIRNLISEIRDHLPDLRYADDGAIDANGKAVYIETLEEQGEEPGLNCSGFVKWISDGILRPFTEKLLSVNSIKERMLDWRGSSFTIRWEETLDPFFGLDWARALARALWTGLHPYKEEESPLAWDVDDSPFALIVSNQQPLNGGDSYRTYSENFDTAGFEIDGLKPLFFKLAITDPGHWYIVQFNARDPQPPRLRRFFHLAAVFPYFDTDGIFKIAVFESAEETSIQRIMSKQYEFAKLVRMPLSGRFDPPPLLP